MIAFTTNKQLVKQLISQATRIVHLERQLNEKDVIIARQLEAINDLENRNDSNVNKAQRLMLDKVRPNKQPDITNILNDINEKLDLVAIPKSKLKL